MEADFCSLDLRMRERGSCGHRSICPIWGRREAAGVSGARGSRSCGSAGPEGDLGLWQRRHAPEEGTRV